MGKKYNICYDNIIEKITVCIDDGYFIKYEYSTTRILI